MLQRARAGDRAAADQLVRRLLPSLRRWAAGRLPGWARDLNDTDDIVQDAVAAAVRRLGAFEYRGSGAIHAYVRQAVANRIRDEVDRARRRPPAVAVEVDPPAPTPSPLEALMGRAELDRYEAGLARLADDEREAIVARLEFGLPYAEVARAIGRPSPDAARMAVARALIRLAREMGRERR